MTMISRILGDIKSVDTARDEAVRARQALVASLHDVQLHLAPAHLVEAAVDEVKARCASLAQDAGQAVRGRAKLAVVGTAAIAFLLVTGLLSRGATRRLRKAATSDKSVSG